MAADPAGPVRSMNRRTGHGRSTINGVGPSQSGTGTLEDPFVDNFTVATGAGTPASTVVDELTYDQPSAVGVSTNYAREDHTHGTPPDSLRLIPVADIDDPTELAAEPGTEGSVVWAYQLDIGRGTQYVCGDGSFSGPSPFFIAGTGLTWVAINGHALAMRPKVAVELAITDQASGKSSLLIPSDLMVSDTAFPLPQNVAAANKVLTGIDADHSEWTELSSIRVLHGWQAILLTPLLWKTGEEMFALLSAAHTPAKFVVSGDQTAFFAAGRLFGIAGNGGGNNGFYRVLSSSMIAGPNTEVLIDTTDTSIKTSVVLELSPTGTIYLPHAIADTTAAVVDLALGVSIVDNTTIFDPALSDVPFLQPRFALENGSPFALSPSATLPLTVAAWCIDIWSSPAILWLFHLALPAPTYPQREVFIRYDR